MLEKKLILMATDRKLLLRVKNIYCYITDETGFDDVYLKVNGKKIWPKNRRFYPVRPGRTKVNVDLGDFDKNTSLEIEVWDFDYISRNDLLGKVLVFLDEPGGPYTTDMIQNQEETLKAKYSIEWEIDFV